MTIHPQLKQGSKDWLDWRMMGLGGSDIASLLGISPYDDATPNHLWLEKTGRFVKPDNFAMRMGRTWEPLVREWYEGHTGIEWESLCGEHDVHSWVHSSFDGVSPMMDLIAEIKCPSAAVHNLAISGKVPDFNRVQIEWQLLTSGAKECRYVSYYGHDKPGKEPKFHESLKFVEIVVKPDHEIQNRIYRIAREFWIRVEAYWAKQSIPKRVA